jgi:hypothetical protein
MFGKNRFVFIFFFFLYNLLLRKELMDEFADWLISSFEAGLPLFEFIFFQEALAISKEKFYLVL